MRRVLGIDAGGSKTVGLLADESGRVARPGAGRGREPAHPRRARGREGPPRPARGARGAGRARARGARPRHRGRRPARRRSGPPRDPAPARFSRPRRRHQRRADRFRRRIARARRARARLRHGLDRLGAERARRDGARRGLGVAPRRRGIRVLDRRARGARGAPGGRRPRRPDAAPAGVDFALRDRAARADPARGLRRRVSAPPGGRLRGESGGGGAGGRRGRPVDPGRGRQRARARRGERARASGARGTALRRGALGGDLSRGPRHSRRRSPSGWRLRERAWCRCGTSPPSAPSGSPPRPFPGELQRGPEVPAGRGQDRPRRAPVEAGARHEDRDANVAVRACEKSASPRGRRRRRRRRRCAPPGRGVWPSRARDPASRARTRGPRPRTRPS